MFPCFLIASNVPVACYIDNAGPLFSNFSTNSIRDMGQGDFHNSRDNYSGKSSVSI